MRPLRVRHPRSARARLRAVPLLCLGLLVPACGGEGANEEGASAETSAEPEYEAMEFPYPLEPAQKRALGPYLASREGWRLAVAADHTGQGLAAVKRERPDYQPYLAEGDLDGDGREDFALVITTGRGAFRIVWFRNAGGAYAPPQPVANVGWMDRAGLFVEEGDLVARELEGERTRRYAWNPDRRRLEAR